MTNNEIEQEIQDNGTTGDTMNEYKKYRKKAIQPMRPYIPGENMTGISVNKEDTPEEGGMIAVNPVNPEDKWYVGKAFFESNYEVAS